MITYLSYIYHFPWFCKNPNILTPPRSHWKYLEHVICSKWEKPSPGARGWSTGLWPLSLAVFHLPLEVATCVQGTFHILPGLRSPFSCHLSSLISPLATFPCHPLVAGMHWRCGIKKRVRSEAAVNVLIVQLYIHHSFNPHNALNRYFSSLHRGIKTWKGYIICVRPFYWLLSNLFLFQNHSSMLCSLTPRLGLHNAHFCFVSGSLVAC